MIRGTNAQFKFKLPYTKSELEWVTIRFWQSNNPSTLLPITKTLQHCDGPDDSVELCVSLTADETARFSDKYKAKVQMRAMHKTSGAIFGSRPQLITVYPMHDAEINGDPTIPPVSGDDFIILDGSTVASNTAGTLTTLDGRTIL